MAPDIPGYPSSGAQATATAHFETVSDWALETVQAPFRKWLFSKAASHSQHDHNSMRFGWHRLRVHFKKPEHFPQIFAVLLDDQKHFATLGPLISRIKLRSFDNKPSWHRSLNHQRPSFNSFETLGPKSKQQGICFHRVLPDWFRL